MRKKIFVMLFILFTALQNVPVGSANSSKTIDSWDNANSTTKKVVITKKELKTEIKKRKKYHKNLLEKYNEWFDEKYLNLISENSLILSSLREELKS